MTRNGFSKFFLKKNSALGKSCRLESVCWMFTKALACLITLERDECQAAGLWARLHILLVSAERAEISMKQDSSFYSALVAVWNSIVNSTWLLAYENLQEIYVFVDLCVGDATRINLTKKDTRWNQRGISVNYHIPKNKHIHSPATRMWEQSWLPAASRRGKKVPATGCVKRALCRRLLSYSINNEKEILPGPRSKKEEMSWATPHWTACDWLESYVVYSLWSVMSNSNPCRDTVELAPYPRHRATSSLMDSKTWS